MKRSEFLKRLGVAAVAVPLAPKAVAEVAGAIKKTAEKGKDKEYPIDISRELYRRYSSKDISEIIKIWHETGTLPSPHYK